MSNKKTNHRLSKLKSKIKKKKTIVKRKDGYYRKGKNNRRIRVRSHNQRYYKRESISDVAFKERIKFYTEQMLKADQAYRDNVDLILLKLQEKHYSNNEDKTALLEAEIDNINANQEFQLDKIVSFADNLVSNDVDPLAILEAHGRIPNMLQDNVSPYLHKDSEIMQYIDPEKAEVQ